MKELSIKNKTLEEYDSSEELEKTISEIRKELSSLISRKESLQVSIEDSYEELRKENVTNENLYEDLLGDIEQLEKDLGVSDDEKSETSQSNSKKKIKKSADVKTLYRKISSLCHPDKTDDKQKHELYIEAKKAYEEGDGDHLEYLYSTIVDQNSSFSAKKRNKEDLQKSIDALKKKLDAEMEEYRKIKDSIQYLIHKRYRAEAVTDQIRARHQYSELLFRKIESAAAKKEELEAKSNKK
jgi:hypothetical protein